MTHVVAGYPDLETSKKLIHMMANIGVDMVEIQIPFSDPLADGPTIMAANQKALENGTVPGNCFEMAEELNKNIDLPLLFMSYVNIPFHMGIKTFIAKSAACGISGLIIPDIPFDEQNENYIVEARKFNIHPIQVISPDMKPQRLEQVAHISSGFIYTTLKIGITGARKQIDPGGLAFIDTIRTYTDLPIAAGFGISSPEQIKTLRGKADMVVIGSHILNLLNREGIDQAMEFLRECKAAL